MFTLDIKCSVVLCISQQQFDKLDDEGIIIKVFNIEQERETSFVKKFRETLKATAFFLLSACPGFPDADNHDVVNIASFVHVESIYYRQLFIIPFRFSSFFRLTIQKQKYQYVLSSSGIFRSAQLVSREDAGLKFHQTFIGTASPNDYCELLNTIINNFAFLAGSRSRISIARLLFPWECWRSEAIEL